MFKRRSSTYHIDRYTCLLWTIIEGKLVIGFKMNALLWHKTTCSETVSINLTFNELWSYFFLKITIFFSRSKTVFNRVLTCGAFWKKCVNATTFRTICGVTKKTRRKFWGISEAEPPRFDCINQLAPQGQCWAQFSLTLVFRHIEFRLGLKKKQLD